ncbi:MAG: response regulator [Lysinibacillus sp.]
MTKTVGVWIVEDDFRVARIHADYVKDIDSCIVSESLRSGNETLRKLKETANLPDIILLDLYIPDVEGYSLIKEIRSLYPAIKIIVISAASEVEHVQDIISLGVFDYIIKPFEVQRLIQSIQRYLYIEKLFFAKEHLSQKEVDELFLQPFKEGQHEPLTKGIDLHTLQSVKSLFEENIFAEMTATTLSEEIGTSRSTARRYLEYLVAEQFLETKLIYGSVGRPERKYMYRETYEQNQNY